MARSSGSTGQEVHEHPPDSSAPAVCHRGTSGTSPSQVGSPEFLPGCCDSREAQQRDVFEGSECNLPTHFSTFPHALEQFLFPRAQRGVSRIRAAGPARALPKTSAFPIPSPGKDMAPESGTGVDLAHPHNTSAHPTVVIQRLTRDSHPSQGESPGHLPRQIPLRPSSPGSRTIHPNGSVGTRPCRLPACP